MNADPKERKLEKCGPDALGKRSTYGKYSVPDQRRDVESPFLSSRRSAIQKIKTIDYDVKIFVSTESSKSGDVSDETVFYYHQDVKSVWAEYSGGDVVRGTLIAVCGNDCELDMRYQHLKNKGELKTGFCHSTPELLSDGRIRLHKKWQWTCGDFSIGESVAEEKR